jgi:hypothetical protein
MQLEGTPDHKDAIPLNSDLNERLNDDRNVIRYHSFPIIVFNNTRPSEEWRRGPNSALYIEGESDGKIEYLVWDNELEASKEFKEQLRKSMINVSGFSATSFGDTENLGQVRSGPALKTLFTNDAISIFLKRSEAEKAEKWLIWATAKMYERHSGEQFENYNAEIMFPEDTFGIDELLRAQIDALKIAARTKGIDEIVAEEHPELTAEEIDERIKKSNSLAELSEEMKVQRQKTPEESQLEQEE